LRGKYYKDLPDKLKESFDNNNVDYVKHLNCSKEEIVYHIVRYNKQKSMNTNENIVARMSNMAINIKEISKKNRFFKDCGVYSETERKNGSIERCVVESIMCMNHLDNWKKQTNAMADYIDENSSAEEFETLDYNLSELIKVVPECANKLFTVKDSFIWFTIYNRFKSTGNKPELFSDFLTHFSNSIDLQNGFKTIKTESNSTKDVSVIKEKIKFIENAIEDYLHINIEEGQPENISVVEFIRENVGQASDIDKEGNDIKRDITAEDIDFYEVMLNDLKENCIRYGSTLLNDSNYLSLMGLVAYSFAKDETLDDWMKDFSTHRSEFPINQKQNYIEMRNDLENYIKKQQKISA